MKEDSIIKEDIDTVETQEWLDSLDGVIARDGEERAAFLVNQLHSKMKAFGLKSVYGKAHIQYMNTIAVEHEPEYPGNLDIENKLEAIHRWNAAVIVAKANKKDGSLGGHIGSGASIMTLLVRPSTRRARSSGRSRSHPPGVRPWKHQVR